MQDAADLFVFSMQRDLKINTAESLKRFCDISNSNEWEEKPRKECEHYTEQVA